MFLICTIVPTAWAGEIRLTERYDVKPTLADFIGTLTVLATALFAIGQRSKLLLISILFSLMTPV